MRVGCEDVLDMLDDGVGEGGWGGGEGVLLVSSFFEVVGGKVLFVVVGVGGEVDVGILVEEFYGGWCGGNVYIVCVGVCFGIVCFLGEVFCDWFWLGLRGWREGERKEWNYLYFR